MVILPFPPANVHFQARKRVFLISLNATAKSRGPYFPVRETVRVLSEVGLADVVKNELRLLRIGLPLAFGGKKRKIILLLATDRNVYALRDGICGDFDGDNC